MRQQQTLQPALHRTPIALDGLERGAVVLDRYGHAWQESSGYWYRSYGDDATVTSHELAQRAPFTLMERAGRIT